jgi:two-component system response regulator HydG
MLEVQQHCRRCQELQALHKLAIELLRLDDYDAMLDTVVRRALEILQAERGFLVLKRGEDLEFKIIRNWSRRELESRREPVSQGILLEVISHAEPIVVRDASNDPRFAQRESVLAWQIRSVLAAPLRLDGAVAGVLYLESSSPDRLFGASDLELFQRMLDLASRALEACLRRLLLEQRTALLEKDFLARYHFPGIVTRDLGFLKVLETAAQAAASSLPVLVQGPSGSGKELIARALHCNSRRATGPFVTINCGAISPALLESELFGYVRGAFTGATADKQGLIASAHGGTVFLDELAELPKDLQAKLLRTLQFGEIQPVGSVRTQTVDVRFVAATNRDLEREVREGRFREDLYYRLNALTILLPALRDRPDDVLPLFHHFVAAAARKEGRPVPEIPPQLDRILAEYSWPGNVRELENEAGRLLALTPQGLPLSAERLSHRLRQAVAPEPSQARLPIAAPEDSLSEKQRLEQALREAGGNRTHAARTLGITREGLRKMIAHLAMLSPCSRRFCASSVCP